MNHSLSVNPKQKGQRTIYKRFNAPIRPNQSIISKISPPMNIRPEHSTAAIITGDIKGKNRIGNMTSWALVNTDMAENNVPKTENPVKAIRDTKTIAGQLICKSNITIIKHNNILSTKIINARVERTLPKNKASLGIGEINIAPQPPSFTSIAKTRFKPNIPPNNIALQRIPGAIYDTFLGVGSNAKLNITKVIKEKINTEKVISFERISTKTSFQNIIHMYLKYCNI